MLFYFYRRQSIYFAITAGKFEMGYCTSVAVYWVIKEKIECLLFIICLLQELEWCRGLVF